jgi:hypothetical protein
MGSLFDKMKLADELMDEAIKLLHQAERLQYAAHLLRGDTGGELAEEAAEPRKKLGRPPSTLGLLHGMKLRGDIRRGEWPAAQRKKRGH